MICRVFRRIKPLEIAAVKSVGSDVTEVSIIAKNMTLTAGQVSSALWIHLIRVPEQFFVLDLTHPHKLQE